jgi:hypothetical protein
MGRGVLSAVARFLSGIPQELVNGISENSFRRFRAVPRLFR